MARNRNLNPRLASNQNVFTNIIQGGAPTATNAPLFYEGVVVDIILNEQHEEYGANGWNIGAAKIRPLNNSLHTTEEDDGKLHFIEPLEMRFAEYPLKGEMVLVHIINGTPFYSKPVYLGKNPAENSYLGLNEDLNDSGPASSPEASNSDQKPKHLFGDYFTPLKNSHFLRPFEGDVILHGRFGNTIRFGSSRIGPDIDKDQGMSPNILIRVGEPPSKPKVKNVDNPQGLIYEDVNLDASSIYIVSDQRIPLIPATKSAFSYLRSAKETKGEFIGSQILLNSDKIIINSKRFETFLFSAEGIHGNALKDITFDTDQNFKVSTNIDTKFLVGRNFQIEAREDALINVGKNTIWTSKTRASIYADKIFLGSREDDKEPIVGGTTLSKFLARLIMALMNTTMPNPPTSPATGPNQSIHVITPVGPGLLAPGVVSALTALYTELVKTNPGQDSPTPFAGAPFNSNDNFVNIQNIEPTYDSVKQTLTPEQRESLEVYKAEILEQLNSTPDSDPGKPAAEEELSFTEMQLVEDELPADESEEEVPIEEIEGICKAIVESAKQDVGLKELSIPDTVNTPPKRQAANSNRHPKIDAMISDCGLNNTTQFNRTGTGYFWCAAAVTKWWRAAGAQVPPNTITTPQGRRIQGCPASVQHWYDWARTFGYLSDVPVVGAAILYFDNKKRIYNHIGIVSSVSPMQTIEGNANDPATPFNRNGVGCFKKAPRLGGRKIVYILPVEGNKISSCALKQLGRTE